MNYSIPVFQKLKLLLVGGTRRGKNIKKNIFGSLFVKAISIIVQIIYVPLLLSYLTQELYGLWITLSMIVGWLNFFDIGFSLGLKNRLTEAIANKDFVRGRELVSTTYGMLIVIFVPLCVICEILIPIVNWSSFLNVSQSLNSTLIIVMRILVAAFCFQMIFNTIGTIYTSLQKVALGNALSVIGSVLGLLVVCALVHFTQASLIYLAVAISIIPLVVFPLVSGISFYGNLSYLRPSIRFFHKEYIKDIFSLGFRFFIIQIQVIIMSQSSSILVSHISSPSFVTYYNISGRYLGVALMVYSIIMGPLWPAFTDAYTKKDFVWMRNIYNKLLKFYLIMFCVIWIMYFVSPYIYTFWIGDKVIVPNTMTLLMAIYICIAVWDGFQVTLINGIGTIKLQSYITILGIFFHIPLSLFLGKYIGAYGVVVSKTIITLTYTTFFTTQIRRILSRKATGIWAA